MKLKCHPIFSAVFLYFCHTDVWCLFTFILQGGNITKDYEEIVYKREQPLIWRDELISNGSVNDSRANGCRNSVQGKTLLVDDEGYVCGRNELLSNGCCDSSKNAVQYNCDTCNREDGCCAIYERCVSCCLNPNKVNHRNEFAQCNTNCYYLLCDCF